MNCFLKKCFLSVVILFLLPIKTIFSQEQEVIKKIIIESNQKKRLLIPSIENKNEKIKLIPPKSITDLEIKKKEQQKEIEAVRKIQEEKRKALEQKREKEIEAARKVQEEKRKALELKRKKEIEDARKAEELKQKKIESSRKAEELKKKKELEATRKAIELKKQKELEAARKTEELKKQKELEAALAELK